MTIVEKNHIGSPWLFRTQPLQTSTTRDISLELAQPPTPVPIPHHPVTAQKHSAQPQQQPQQEQQRVPQSQNLRPRVPAGPIPTDPKKVVKSSTAPNLPTSKSLSEMFRVI